VTLKMTNREVNGAYLLAPDGRIVLGARCGRRCSGREITKLSCGGKEENRSESEQH
jgi:hypothetical protein